MARAEVKSVAGSRTLVVSTDNSPETGNVYVGIDTRYDSANLTVNRENFIEAIKAAGIVPEDLREPTEAEKYAERLRVTAALPNGTVIERARGQRRFHQIGGKWEAEDGGMKRYMPVDFIGPDDTYTIKYQPKED